MKFAILLTAVASASAFVAPQHASRASTFLFDATEAVEPVVEAKIQMGAKAISALTQDIETVFSSEDIDKILPHRYPFALVDKVIEYEAGVVS